jgi:hypothetical protein
MAADCRLPEVIISHAHQVLGHLGRTKAYRNLFNFYWWSSMASKVDKFCPPCVECQRTKPSNRPPLSLLKSLPVPSYPWESVGIDFVGPITESYGFNFIMVVINCLTSMVHIVPMNSTASASDIAWQFLDKVVKLHGYPKSIVSDRDAQFTSQFWRQL